MIRVRLSKTVLNALWGRIGALCPCRGRCCPHAAVLAVTLSQAKPTPTGSKLPELSAEDAATLHDLLSDIARSRLREAPHARRALRQLRIARRLNANSPPDGGPSGGLRGGGRIRTAE